MMPWSNVVALLIACSAIVAVAWAVAWSQTKLPPKPPSAADKILDGLRDRCDWWTVEAPPVQDEDAGYSDHLVGQTLGPFYCGITFCGHITKAAARACWMHRHDALAALQERQDAAIANGTIAQEFAAIQREREALLNRNSVDWPISKI